MATFNTVEELIQILDENPHWLEALRARLLPASCSNSRSGTPSSSRFPNKGTER